MPDGQQYDLSTAARDPDFLKAGTGDKIAFLSAHDADFSKAAPADKAGYINHILGNDQKTPFEKRNEMGPVGRQLNSLALGAASGASGLPETMNPLEDAAPKPKGIGDVLKDAAIQSVGPLPGIAAGLYRAGKDIVAPSGTGDDAAEQRAHGFGSLAGQIAPALVGEAVDSGATSLRGTRSALAQKAVAPLVKKPLGATQTDIAFGRNPAQAITDEGLVGTKNQMVNQATKRIGQLSTAADKQLANHPNANTVTDIEPIIDGAIDSAQQAARRSGSKGAINRLEDLREALKTQYGDLQGTPLELNRLKQQIGDTASDLGAFKHTDPLESSAASAMSDIYTRLNDHIKSQVPEVAPINDRTANLISARMGLKRNAALESNKSLFEGSLSTLPFRMFNKTAGSAPVRSVGARLLNAGNTLDIPSPPARTPQNTPQGPRGLLGEGATALPYTDTSGPVPMSERTPPTIYNNLRSGPPPPVDPRFSTQATGTIAENPAMLGSRGTMGTRFSGPRGLLSAPESNSPISVSPYSPPQAFNPRYAVEPTGRMENPNLLGTRGTGGQRIGQRGRLLPAPPTPGSNWMNPPEMTPSPYSPPAPRPQFNPFEGLPESARETKLSDYTPDEVEEGKLLIRQTIDMMQSADKPGRYYAENQPGEFNSQRQQSSSKGVTSGGHWFGVKSTRDMLPWIKDTSFTPSQLEKALKSGESSPTYQRAVKSAADFVRREKQNRQPGED